jgi:hypothetical protein
MEALKVLWTGSQSRNLIFGPVSSHRHVDWKMQQMKTCSFVKLSSHLFYSIKDLVSNCVFSTIFISRFEKNMVWGTYIAFSMGKW